MICQLSLVSSRHSAAGKFGKTRTWEQQENTNSVSVKVRNVGSFDELSTTGEGKKGEKKRKEKKTRKPTKNLKI